MENNNLFEDMPEAPTPPKLPKYFPDLQGENRGLTPGAGWYQNEFLPWIQNQDPKKLVGYGIGMFLLAGKFARILTDFFDFPKFCFFAFRNCCSFGLRNPQIPGPNSRIERPSHSTNQRCLGTIGTLFGRSKGQDFGFARRFQRKSHEFATWSFLIFGFLH